MASMPPSTMTTDVALVVTLICSTTIIAIFDPHGNYDGINFLNEINYLLHEQFFKDPNNNIYEVPWYTQSIIHPSPITFCISVIVFAYAGCAFYRFRSRDKYRDHVLAAFTLLAIFLPLMSGAGGNNLKDRWQVTLPWAYTLGLISSGVGHWIWRRLPQEKPIVIDYNYDWDEKIRAGQKLPYYRGAG